MKLPEAIALMLEGKVMVDKLNAIIRAEKNADDDIVFFLIWGLNQWSDVSAFTLDGWREATPEELKEINA